MMHVLICNIVVTIALGVGLTAYGGVYVSRCKGPECHGGRPFAVTCIVLGPLLLLLAAVGIFVVLPRAKDKVATSAV